MISCVEVRIVEMALEADRVSNEFDLYSPPFIPAESKETREAKK